MGFVGVFVVKLGAVDGGVGIASDEEDDEVEAPLIKGGGLPFGKVVVVSAVSTESAGSAGGCMGSHLVWVCCIMAG